MQEEGGGLYQENLSHYRETVLATVALIATLGGYRTYVFTPGYERMYGSFECYLLYV